MYDLKRKIIFTHVPKTGGTTIEAAFGWHPNFNVGLGEEYVKYFFSFKHGSLSHHIQALKEQNFNHEEFFKFSCIRNPWDIIVSRFFHDKNVEINEKNKKALEHINTLNFDSYVEYRFNTMKYDWFNVESFFYYEEKYCMDYLIRYENYKEDAEKVFNRYNVTWPKINYNTKSRPKNTPYKEFYTNLTTKIIVEEAAKEYIKLFGYKF